jgi:hypothetical protein
MLFPLKLRHECHLWRGRKAQRHAEKEQILCSQKLRKKTNVDKQSENNQVPMNNYAPVSHF